MNDKKLFFMEHIKNMIHTIRGVKVMLDSDLAQLYGYTTKAFNQQVKNNIEKFDSDFRFQLTRDEYHEILRSKNLTLKLENDFLRSIFLTSKDKRGGRQYLPFVFTEQGIYMLMTVLKGELATKQSKALIRTFKEMKDFILTNNIIKSKELLQISLQTTQNTNDIAKIKSEMFTKSDFAKFIDNFTENKTNEILILNGEYFNADIAYNNIYDLANKSIYIVDNYIGIKTLLLIKNIRENIKVFIFSDNINKGLHQFEYDDFKKQYPNIDISFYRTNSAYHDRYIIIDYNTSIINLRSSKSQNLRNSETQKLSVSVTKKILNS